MANIVRAHAEVLSTHVLKKKKRTNQILITIFVKDEPKKGEIK
jgi:hypothetical protein